MITDTLSPFQSKTVTLGKLIYYPQELKARLAETGSLEIGDTVATAEDIWRFMTIEGPRRYPHFFISGYSGMSGDAGLICNIKRDYLVLTQFDRLSDANMKGVPIVLTHGYQSEALYEASGYVSLSLDQASQWAATVKGKTAIKAQETPRIGSVGKQEMTFEACYPAKYELDQEGILPISLIAMNVSMRCSDLTCGAVDHAHNGLKTPVFLIDAPVGCGQDPDKAVDYLAENLRQLVFRLSRLKKSEPSDEALKNAIKHQNQAHRLARKYVELWWSASIPPTMSEDHNAIIRLGSESYGAPAAAIRILEESYGEVKDRVDHSFKGPGLAEDPVRLFICGSCINPEMKLVDSCGGVVVGWDDVLCNIDADIEETGDPYEKMAQAIITSPYEMAEDERGRWVSAQVRRSRAEGLIFMYQPGCNYQSAAARIISDIVEEETGISSMILERSMTQCPCMAAQEQLRNRIEAFIEMLQ